MKTFEVLDPDDFKRRNLDNWKINTEFWLQAELPHLRHLQGDVAAIIRKEASEKRDFVLVDIGCGTGWVYDLLKRHSIPGRYIGVDFNAEIIAALRQRHPELGADDLLVADIEKYALSDIVGKADVVVNAFNFFEIPRLEAAFSNCLHLLRPGGGLLVCHIDPLSQLLSITADRNELMAEVEVLSANRGQLRGYDKVIDVEGGSTERTYRGILYKISDYHRLARERGCVLEEFVESCGTAGRSIQWFQVALWRVSNRGRNVHAGW